MEVNEANLIALSNYLSNTLSPDPSIRKPAENFLQTVETNEGYPRLLLALLQNAHAPLEIRIACAITFKNFVKRNWRVIEGESKVAEGDRNFVRTGIIELLLTTPDAVQRQLAEAISLIGLEDFPDRWPELIPSLVSYCQSNDFQLLSSILQTANTLFKRYRHEMRSDQLWREIKYVLDSFAPTLTRLFQHTLTTAKQRVSEATSAAGGDVATKKEELRKIFFCLSLTAKIFYSLNAQDLPEYFEDNMNVWMSGFLELLKLDVPMLRGATLNQSVFGTESNDDGDPGVLEHLHSSICDAIAVYAQKYEEEFAPFLPPFVEVVWHLLLSTGQQTKYDLLVATAIQFLSSVCEREQYKQLFASGDTLAQICERVIIPNMEFRKSDEELFEDNPEEFIRKDIEGSDVDTRRRAASDFVKALCVNFEADVIRIFAAYIQQLFGQYASDPSRFWAKKDAAVYLVVSLASRGQTVRMGATKTSELVNLVDFFGAHIKPELFASDANSFPVLKADALKYIVTFRTQLPSSILLESIPAICRLLKADSIVVHTYAAHAFERLFTLRNATGNGPLIAKEDAAPFAGDLLSGLCSILERPGSYENDYAMKCIMRSILLLSDAVLPAIDDILAKLAQKLIVVSKNPSKPHFNHFLFESICVLIKTAAKHQRAHVGVDYGSKFEQALFPIFEDILKNDVMEFIPYVFQVLSMMLDIRGVGGGVPDSYMALFPCLLSPTLWDRPGNVPALVKLLQAYIRVGPEQAASGTNLSQLLGIFQKLIASRQHDHEGFYLLDTIVEYGGWNQLQPFLDGVLRVLFGRLSNTKTIKFVKGLIIFLSLFVIKFGASTLVAATDSIQNDLFGMLVERVLLQDAQKVTGSLEKKICCVGLTKLLTDSPDLFVVGKYNRFWPKLFQAIIGIFELPEEDATDDELFLNIEDTPGYTAAYSQLAFASSPEIDPTGVDDAKRYLANSLQKLNLNRPGCLSNLFVGVDDNAKAFAQQYMNAAGISF